MEAARQKPRAKRMRSKRRYTAPKPPGLTVKQVLALKARLRLVVCAEFWVHAQVVTRVAEINGAEVNYSEHDPAVVPAGLVRCRGCGRQTPPPYVTSSGHCEDCHQAVVARIEDEISGAEPQSFSLVVMVDGVPKRYMG